MNCSLVLSGGATRGAFHLGVLQAIEDMGIKIKYISGSSIGALIGASYASGVSPKEQFEIFSSKEFKKHIKFNYFKGSLIKFELNKPLLKRLLPVEKLEKTNIKCFISATDMIDGKNIIYDRGDMIKLCMASCSVVPLFAPVYYEGKRLADGGITDNFPINCLLGYDLPIIGSDLHPLNSAIANSFLSLFKRTLFLLWKASVVKNINHCDIYITNPKLSNYSMFNFNNFLELYQMGYTACMEKFNEIEKGYSDDRYRIDYKIKI